MKAKSVSKNYAVNEFLTIGLVLILYCLFVLFLPFVGNGLKDIIGGYEVFGFDVFRVGSIACIIIGTILPFMMLRIAGGKKLKDFINRPRLSVGEHVINYVVFFAAISACIFLTMMLGQFVNVSGELVYSIGITVNNEYLSDILYVVMFVLITPIIEEYAFRGCLLFSLSKYGKFFAYIASSIIYALAHGSFVEMIPAFFMGTILSKLSLRYKSIIPSTIVHILFNLSLYLLFLVPESFSLYMIIGLAIMFVLAGVLLVTKMYKVITIKKSNSNKQVTLLFFSSFSVLFALFLFIIHSILLTII